MKRRRSGTLIPWASLLTICLAGRAAGVTITIPLAETTEIKNDSGSNRLLAQFEDLSLLTGKKILYGRLVVGIDADTCHTPLNSVIMAPLKTHWSVEAVSWGTPWVEAGGDTVDVFAHEADIGQGRYGDTEFLVTTMVQAWADGHLADCGILLIPVEQQCSYKLRQVNANLGIWLGVLIVRYVESQE